MSLGEARCSHLHVLAAFLVRKTHSEGSNGLKIYIYICIYIKTLVVGATLSNWSTRYFSSIWGKSLRSVAAVSSLLLFHTSGAALEVAAVFQPRPLGV